MDAAVAEIRSSSLTIDRFASHFSNRFAPRSSWLSYVWRCRSVGIEISGAAEAFYTHIENRTIHPPSQFYCSLRSTASVSPRNQPRLSSCTALSFKPFSIYVSPYERDRHSKMKLQPRATNFCNSLSCRIPLGNVPCREGVGRLSERDGKLRVRCCRYS